MRRYRFNEQQQAEYQLRVKEYYNERFFLKDAKQKARRDVENMIFIEELEQSKNKKEGKQDADS